jgi:hypothetical protein
MKIKIANPKYEYKDDGSLIYKAICQLYNDEDKYLFEREITSTKSILEPDWYNNLQIELVMQGKGILASYQQMIAPIDSLFPCCNTPDEIATRIAQTIETLIADETLTSETEAIQAKLIKE